MGARLFITLHVVGFSLSCPADRASLGLVQAFHTSHLRRVSIPGSNWRLIHLQLQNPSCAELALVQYADSQRSGGLPEGASDTSAVGNKRRHDARRRVQLVNVALAGVVLRQIHTERSFDALFSFATARSCLCWASLSACALRCSCLTALSRACFAFCIACSTVSIHGKEVTPTAVNR